MRKTSTSPEGESAALIEPLCPSTKLAARASACMTSLLGSTSHPGSMIHALEQQSPPPRFPSSHCSDAVLRVPLPHDVNKQSPPTHASLWQSASTMHGRLAPHGGHPPPQ